MDALLLCFTLGIFGFKPTNMTTLRLYILLFAMTSFWGSMAQAVIVSPYPYPDLNTLESTLTTISLKGTGGQRYRLNIKKMSGDSASAYHYTAYTQNHQAPCLFLVAGLGGNDQDHTARYIANLLYQQGFHVIVLGSTFTPEFINAASTSGFVGQAYFDAQDLYKVMYLLKRALPKTGMKIKNWGLVGFSYGALLSAHITRLEERSHAFNFRRTLLINPPVNILYGMDTLDSFYNAYKGNNLKDKIGILILLKKFFDAVTGYLLPDYKDFQLSKKLSKRQMMSLIGKSFHSSLLDVITTLKKLDSKNKLLNVRRYSFVVYLTEFIKNFYTRHPYGIELWQKDFGIHPFSTQRLNDKNSMFELASTLRNNKRLIIFHNQDDFLMRPQDFQFLKSNVDSNRLYLFPKGGHLGNVWHPVFQGLLQQKVKQAFSRP